MPVAGLLQVKSLFFNLCPFCIALFVTRLRLAYFLDLISEFKKCFLLSPSVMDMELIFSV